MENSPLNSFHPLIKEWFSTIGEATDIQAKAWPLIARGEHVLVTAPTGSGKTLTAFLWAINQLVTGAWPPSMIRVLYISPLKALNNDIRRNLLGPLEELRELFRSRNLPFPDIHVATRSGDTPDDERRRMMRRPPEILVTTPESLNIMLTSKKGRELFRGIETLILDEIHAIFTSKRGVHCMTAVERLIPLSGEFQRIALSATVKPPEEVATFVGGYIPQGSDPDSHYEPRKVTILKSERKKEYDITVAFPADEIGRAHV